MDRAPPSNDQQGEVATLHRPGPGRWAPWAMWGLAVSVYLTAVFHRNGLAVASITAEHRFDVGPSVLAALVAVQLGIYALMQIPAGTMADRFGSRRMLVAAVVLMGTGEIVFSVAHVAAVALVGRALIGLGDAVTFLSVLRLVQNWFPATRYGLLASLTGLVGALGQLVSTAPLHAGLVHLGWTAVFAIAGGATLVVAVPVAVALRDRPGPRRSDEPAAAQDHPGLAGAVREVAAQRGTWRGMWAHFSLTGPFALFTALWGYPFLVRAEHYGAGRASDALALVVLSAAVGSPLVGTLMVRAPQHRTTVVYGLGTAMVVVWVAVLAVGPGNDPGWLVVVLLVVTGLGAPGSAPAFDLAREANRADRGGTATGVVNVGGFTGAVVADLVIGVLLANAVGGGHAPGDFRLAMIVFPVMITAGLLLFWRLRPPTSGQSPARKRTTAVAKAADTTADKWLPGTTTTRASGRA